jgi:FKBP-type peptidyl-prolyl cis-trans isomerase FkpA/FKBP-type peptidyl-prolyl cis-trans isomerase FklB
MKLSNSLVTVLAGTLMAVSLSACGKNDNAADAKSSKAPEITSTAVGTETVKGIAGQNNEQKQVSYMIGMDIAKSLEQIKQEIDVKALNAGLTDQMNGKSLLNEEQHKQIREAFAAKLQAHAEKTAAELPKKNLAEGTAFLAKNKTAKDVVTTASGLQYQVLRQGTGPKPAPTDMVKVHYKGTLLNGEEFDSSYARNEPVDFPLNQVVPGWSEGVGLMSVGSKYKFWIPAALAYGEAGSPPVIGPNATLVFEVELLGINPAVEQTPAPATAAQ